MSEKKLVAAVSFACIGALAHGMHSQWDCRPSTELCQPMQAVLPDIPHENHIPSGPLLRYIPSLTSSTSSTLSLDSIYQ